MAKPKKENFQFAPSRFKGVVFLSIVCLILIGTEVFLLRNFDISQVGLQFFLLLIALIILAVPLALLLYRLYSLIFSYYRLERDGLHIQWGLRTEVIPLNAIEWIRRPSEMTVDVPWSVMPMPGAYLGTVETKDGLTFEFLASDMGKMLFLGTSRYIYAISPQHPEQFLIGFERILQMGALTNVQWTTTRPGNWLLEAWNNKPGRISTILSMAFLILTYIWVGSRFRVNSTVFLSFSATGEPVEAVSSVNMLVIPLAATIIWVVGTVLGLWVFQQKNSRRAAELVWGAVAAAILQCFAATLMIF